MTLAGVPASGGWCVDGVNIDVNHMDMDVHFFVVILCRTCMSVILTCMPLTCLAVLDTHVKFTDMDVHAPRAPGFDIDVKSVDIRVNCPLRAP